MENNDTNESLINGQLFFFDLIPTKPMCKLGLLISSF